MLVPMGTAMRITANHQYATFSDLPLAELAKLWRLNLGGAAPQNLPKFLLPRLLAYRIQVQQHGGPSKSAVRFLDHIADDLIAGREPATPYPDDTKLKLGCVIVREHEGINQRVMVLEEGYAWNGKTYNSLSSVAKAITGTNWNGHRFFGLKAQVLPAAETST
jgi:Protein of unknown function (DUF2924)